MRLVAQRAHRADGNIRRRGQCVDQRKGACFLEHVAVVGRYRHTAKTEVLRFCFEPLRITSGELQIPAVAAQPACDGATDVAGGPHHEGRSRCGHTPIHSPSRRDIADENSHFAVVERWRTSPNNGRSG